MRTRDVLRLARRLGARAGKSAASWVFDGNTAPETYRAVLKGIEDGDPMILDSLNVPNLSGEWAGDPTPATLAERCDLAPERDPDGWRLDALCSAWEEAAANTFWAEVERTARYHVA